MTPIDTKNQPADLMTKCHGPQSFAPLRDMIVSPINLGYKIQANYLYVEYRANEEYKSEQGRAWIARRGLHYT